MALPLTTLLREITEKAGLLGETNRQLNDRIRELESENESLRRDLDAKEKDLQAARRDPEFLTMSHRLADSPDSIVSARRQIARLIRNVDKCISMLKEE